MCTESSDGKKQAKREREREREREINRDMVRVKNVWSKAKFVYTM